MNKPVETVSRHGLKIELRRYARGYGFDRKDEHGRQIQIRHQLLEDARQAAIDALEAGVAGRVDLQRVDQDDYLQFLKWRSSRGQPRPVAGLVRDFLAEKQSRNVSFWTLRDYKGALDLFALTFGDEVLTNIPRRAVVDWLDARGVGPRRWNNLLSALKALCVWARQNRVLTAELHDIETIAKKKIRSEVETYTPDEIKAILAKVEPEWLPVVALGAFAGIRPEEVCPDPRSGKPGLCWRDIDLKRGKVIVPASVAKTRHKRFVPINDALRSFLSDCGPADEPIAPQGKSFQNQMRRWTTRWIRDGLRHSYGSYRLAILQDMQALALEMGNSPAVIRQHYLDLKFPEEGEAWFKVRKA